MKIVARTNKPIVGVEVVLKPVEVQVPAIVVPVEVRYVTIVVVVAPNRNIQDIFYAFIL